MEGKFRWVVEIEVSENWVADGFDMNQDRVQRLKEELIPWAISGEEVDVRVLKSPDAESIRWAQGYGYEE